MGEGSCAGEGLVVAQEKVVAQERILSLRRRRSLCRRCSLRRRRSYRLDEAEGNDYFLGRIEICSSRFCRFCLSLLAGQDEEKLVEPVPRICLVFFLLFLRKKIALKGFLPYNKNVTVQVSPRRVWLFLFLLYPRSGFFHLSSGFFFSEED